MQWDGEAVERVVRDEGGAIAVVRTADEWRAHPVGRRPAAKPVVEMTKIGDSDPVVLPKGGELPLTGLKVLDNTHVIGGPITTRTLAEFGAEMLHLSHPATPDHMNWRLETDIGKRAAYCDLDDGSGQAQLFSGCCRTPTYSRAPTEYGKHGHRPTVWRTRNGHHRPRTALLRLGRRMGEYSCFDMMAVRTTGYVASEGAIDAPQMPIQVILADYLAGYAGAAGIAAALLRRSREGRSYQVQVSLCRMAMWTQELGLLDHAALNGWLPMLDIASQSDAPLRTIASAFTYLPSQIAMSKIQQHFARGPWSAIGRGPR